MRIIVMRKDKINNLKEGERVAGISTIIILLLALVEAVVGFLSGSVILITDALHNAADSMTSFASWFSLKISQRKPTEKFPYGYYKVESLATLFVSGFILYAAYELLTEGYSKLFIISELTMPIQALGITLVSLIVSFFMARYMRKMGEKIDSQSLIVNSQERLTHVFSSAIIFVVILLTIYKVPYVEGAITIFFSLVVFKVGIFAAKDSVFALMDISPSEEIEDKIRGVINSIAGTESFENMRLRKAGPFVFGEVNVKIRKHVDVKRAHEISDNIENKIKDEVEQVDSFTIHVEPYEAEELKLVIPIKQDKGLNSEAMDQFGRANYFIFVTINKKRGEVRSTYVKENPYKKKSVKAGFAAVNFIVKEKIDVLITREMGGISFHTLRDHLVDVYKIKGEFVGKIIDKFIKNELEHLTEPTKEGIPEVEPKPIRDKGGDRGFGRRGRRGVRWQR